MKILNFTLMPYRPMDIPASKQHRSAWVVLPNTFYDPELGAQEYESYIDMLAESETLGFDGVCVNEHHQTAYGLMPAPNLIASALIQRTKRIRIAILGRALPLVGNPIHIAEEFAMLDNMSRGRIIAGFVRGIGAEYHTFGINPTISHDRFHEAHDLIVQAWTRPGPFSFTGRHYNLEYVNLWPRPFQNPHPPIWVPSQGSKETIDWAALPNHRYTYLQTFSPAAVVEKYLQSYRDTAQGYGYEAADSQLGWAVPVYVSDTDDQARKEAKVHFELFRNRLLKMPIEMLLPPGYTSRDSLKNLMKAKASLSQDLTIDKAIDMGMFVCGTANTVRQMLEDHWSKMHFDNLLTMMHFGSLPQDLTKRSMEMFAKDVLPHIQKLKRTEPAVALA